MTCTLIGMGCTFCITLFAIAFVVWLGARRLTAHYKENPEAVRSFVLNVVMPLLGPKRKGVAPDGDVPVPGQQEQAAKKP